MLNPVKIVKSCQICEILLKLWNSVEIVKFCQICEILSNCVEIMMSEHCVRHCTLIMVCGIVLGKAKMTKVGMVWYEFNIVNESMNEWMNLQGRYRAARAAKKTNIKFGPVKCKYLSFSSCWRMNTCKSRFQTLILLFKLEDCGHVLKLV